MGRGQGRAVWRSGINGIGVHVHLISPREVVLDGYFVVVVYGRCGQGTGGVGAVRAHVGLFNTCLRGRAAMNILEKVA